MDRPTSIPQHIWDIFSDEARALVGAVIDGLERQIIELGQQVQDLKARLDQNSTNSSKPPSTDPIGVKRKPPEPPSKRRRGGQKGHPRRMRALVPPERVASVTDCKPTQCRRCRHPLSGEDAEPRRHQVAELPPIEPDLRDIMPPLTQGSCLRPNRKWADPIEHATRCVYSTDRPACLK